MGRLSYVNRKIEGEKLGQAVAKDLTKRIPPHQGSKAALRDPMVEIDVNSKNLTDAGFTELASSLLASIDHDGPQGRVTLLTEFKMGGCDLTVHSLEALAPIIYASCQTLQELDLSDNRIAIQTQEDVAIWSALLESFSECCVLRCVDLSGNALGEKAFEVLARIYAKEGQVDLAISEDSDIAELTKKARQMSVASAPQTTNNVQGTTVATFTMPSPKRWCTVFGPQASEFFDSTNPTTSLFPIYATTKGLHSIPYLVLSNTSMSDTSALYLSHVIAEHHTPERLLPRVPPAKAGPSQAQLEGYDDGPCRGIIFLPNIGLGKDGKDVLRLADDVRAMLVDDPSSDEEARGTASYNSATSGALTHLMRKKTRPGASHTAGAHAISIHPLDHARHRIQGETLDKLGHRGNDLWRVSIKMLSIARQIQPIPLPKVETSPVKSPTKPKGPIIKTLEIPGFPPLISKKAHALSSGNPNQGLEPRSTHSTGGKKLSIASTIRSTIAAKTSAAISSVKSRPATVKNSTSPPTSPTKAPVTGTPTRNSIHEIAAKHFHERTLTHPYRTRLPLGFSHGIWAQIIAMTIGADEILSIRQCEQVMRYATDHTTLEREREWLGQKEGSQLWRVLDGMGCLAYEKMDT